MNISTPNAMTVGDAPRKDSFIKPALVEGLYDSGDIYDSDYNDEDATTRKGWKLSE